MLTLLAFKAVVVAVLFLAWAVPKVQQRYRSYRKWAAVPQRARTANVRRRRRRGSVFKVLQKTDWVRVFRVVSMVLFVAYPSVSMKILQLFRCRGVEGVYWLVADMRLQCFTRTWFAYSMYGVGMIVLYVGGLPLMIIATLYKHRKTLFGPGSDTTEKTYGFLYFDYGPDAWFWETEELLRKLLLTSVAVLLDQGSPLQVWHRVLSCSVVSCRVLLCDDVDRVAFTWCFAASWPRVSVVTRETVGVCVVVCR